MKLSPYQKKALGIKRQSEAQGYIWNHTLSKVYKQIDERNLNLGDEGQTFKEFLQMEKQEPNQEGTGRYKFVYIDRIEILFIKKKGSPDPPHSIISIICNFISKYLKISCQPKLLLKMQIDQSDIVDKKKNIAYQIKSNNGLLDAHDILAILMEYQSKKTILAAFVQNQLQEEGNEVDGRAYGDGVAVIAYEKDNLQKNLEFYLQTVLHETLHTLGFDHCLAWKCLMNGYTNFQSWLCPACLKKLFHQLKIRSLMEASDWMKQIMAIFSQINARNAIRKGKQIIECLNISLEQN